jgi:hypothetical protein
MLPGSVPWSVKQSLIKLCIRNWASISSDALSQIEVRVKEEAERLVKAHFERFQLGGLEEEAK